MKSATTCVFILASASERKWLKLLISVIFLMMMMLLLLLLDSVVKTLVVTVNVTLNDCQNSCWHLWSWCAVLCRIQFSFFVFCFVLFFVSIFIFFLRACFICICPCACRVCAVCRPCAWNKTLSMIMVTMMVFTGNSHYYCKPRWTHRHTAGCYSRE